MLIESYMNNLSADEVDSENGCEWKKDCTLVNAFPRCTSRCPKFFQRKK